MKCFVIGLGFLILLLQPKSAFGDGTPSPIAFNFSPGAQTAKDDQTVVGFRGNVFYGENKNVFGFDLGLLVSNTRETFGGAALAGLANITGTQAVVVGIQFAGLANVNRGKATVLGFEIAGLLNSIKDSGDVYGVQLAAVNLASKTDIHGAQVGLFNRAQKVAGIQLGILNFADTLHGIQLGLLNFCNHGGLFGAFPVLNVGF